MTSRVMLERGRRIVRIGTRVMTARPRTATFALAAASGLALMLTLGAARAAAQVPAPELPQVSPKARVEQRVGLTDFAIDYSSPGVKGRKIWGELLPFDELWRAGANAPTTLKASADFTFGDTRVPAGTYVILAIPGKKTWTVILNSNTKLQGTRGYAEKDDVARVSVKAASVPARERLAFQFADTTDNSTRLDLEWEKLRVSVPIQVDTATQARANIDKALGEAWRPHFSSARYLLDTGGDLTEALGFIDSSIAIKSTWWNNWVRAQILAKQHRPTDAVAAAEQAQTLGAGDPVFDGFFKKDVDKAIADWRKKS